jgi:hypothetical protein
MGIMRNIDKGEGVDWTTTLSCWPKIKAEEKRGWDGMGGGEVGFLSRSIAIGRSMTPKVTVELV